MHPKFDMDVRKRLEEIVRDKSHELLIRNRAEYLLAESRKREEKEAR